MTHINIQSKEQELSNTNLNEESNLNNVENIEAEIDENDNESNSNDDVEEEEIQVQDQLDQWLKIFQENNENLDDLDFNLDIDDIDHPAENNHAKWNLKIMFKDNLHFPF